MAKKKASKKNTQPEARRKPGGKAHADKADPQPEAATQRSSSATDANASSGSVEAGTSEADPTKKPFTPPVLDRTLIARPLLKAMEDESQHHFDVIIDLNLDYPGGRENAKIEVEEQLDRLLADLKLDPREYGHKLFALKNKNSKQYLYARLTANAIRELARRERVKAAESNKDQWAGMYRIWPDFDLEPLIYKSITTIKADAARNSFAAVGDGIIWAVIDSGIDKSHAHFQEHQTLELPGPLLHQDFSGGDSPLTDEFGHGTHVAGIIAGRAERGFASRKLRDENDEVMSENQEIGSISGIAPKCKVLSLKVLNEKGRGKVSNLIAALDYIQELNGNGRRIRIHGVNLSVGYGFEPEWFACGQSPLCVEVDRLVRSGVVVVVAAGNTGYGMQQTQARGLVNAGMDQSINDPGNAELAITVGSTHRDMPHIYGVSYFSSKGPTGDGRLKPDLLAPGEKIISCASTQVTDGPKNAQGLPQYKEDSGTSMAAPHVSGAIAAFLSVRQEFIGQPLRVKEIFLNSATDLRRAPYFQGRGLVDLMRAMQSV